MVARAPVIALSRASRVRAVALPKVTPELSSLGHMSHIIVLGGITDSGSPRGIAERR